MSNKPSRANLHDPVEQAARAVGVSRRSVYYAIEVQEKGVPELSDACWQGELRISRAAKLARLPEDEQRQRLQAYHAGDKQAIYPEKLEPKPFDYEKERGRLEHVIRDTLKRCPAESRENMWFAAYFVLQEFVDDT